MIEHIEYLQLEAKLRLHSIFFDGGFEYFFKSEDAAGEFMSAGVDFSKLA